ncbi:MAG: hypothetical protein HFJ54_06525 [Clostridia bacterium]|nr:hypothetical protein [Clostridia bacterium]
MGRRKKVNKNKFLSRIFLLVVIVIIILILFSNIFKKKNKDEFDLRIIIDNQDITESLVSDIYIDKDGVLYMSMEDVKNIFDNDLYFEENTKKIITTSETKVAAIDTRSDKMEINSAVIMLSTGVIDYGTTYYIPVSEMTKIYNIEVITTEKSAIINSLYKELTTVKTTKKVSLKEKGGFFGGTIQKLEQDKEVIFIENSEKKGWIKVLTYEGKIGYIKEKNTSEKNQKRVDMNNEHFTDKEPDINNSIELTKKTLTNENLRDFTERKKVIEDIIAKMLSKEKYTVYLNIEKTDVDSDFLDRFIIELIPRIKEIGGSIARNWRKYVKSKNGF